MMMKYLQTATVTLAIIGLMLWSAHAQGQNTDVPSVQVRLQDGLNDREGRVEVFYEDQWGTICDDGWDSKDSGVICRMLGFIGVSRAHNGSYFPRGDALLRLWLDEVTCDGNEPTIAACQHTGWGISNCDHSEDAGVTCLGDRVSTTTVTTPRTTTTTAPPTICNDSSTDVRLVDDPNGNDWIGRLQVQYLGSWYEVCDDFWGLSNAQVICRMLCYNPANARAYNGPTFGNITEDFLLDNVQCAGTEDSIFNCTANPYFDHNCIYSEGVGVSCMPDNPTPRPAPDPDIICDDEKITARFLRVYDERLETGHLTCLTVQGVGACGYTTLLDNDYVSISIPFIGCGTTRDINDTHIIYENQVRYEVPPEDPLITRRQIFKIPVLCVMGRNDDPDNAVEPEEQTVPPQHGTGHFEVNMYIYRDGNFDEAIQEFPAEIRLGHWVYVALSLVSTDQQLKIVVPRCYTTPDQNPESEPKYFLIQDKCALEDSIALYPLNRTMFGFRFQSFKFIGDYDVVYLHCKAYVCGVDEKDSKCDRTCAFGSSGGGGRKKRDLTDISKLDDYEIIFPNHTVFHMEKGPVIFIDDPASTTIKTDSYTNVSKEIMRNSTLPVTEHVQSSTPTPKKSTSTVLSSTLPEHVQSSTLTSKKSTSTVLSSLPVGIPPQPKLTDPNKSSTIGGLTLSLILMLILTLLLHV